MPTVEKVYGGRVYIRPLGRQFEIGDREEVTNDQARYLCEERGDFARVDSGGETYTRDTIDQAPDEDERVDTTPDEDASADSDVEADDGGDLADADASDEDESATGQIDGETAQNADEAAEDENDGESGQQDGEEAADDEPDEDGFDADEWLDDDYTDRAADVRAGEVDEHLGTIEDVDRSDTVLDAVEERRTELEG